MIRALIRSLVSRRHCYHEARAEHWQARAVFLEAELIREARAHQETLAELRGALANSRRTTFRSHEGES